MLILLSTHQRTSEGGDFQDGRRKAFEAEAESQLLLLGHSVSTDVTATHQGFPELVQVWATGAGLLGGEGRGFRRGQKSLLLQNQSRGPTGDQKQEETEKQEWRKASFQRETASSPPSAS